MSFFACAVNLDGGPVPDGLRRRVEASRFCRERRVQWHTAAGLVCVVGLDHGTARGAVARLGKAVAVGAVRLDNRREVRRWTACAEPGASDLELVLRLVSGGGNRVARRIAQLIGDFAFVVWDPTTHEVIAARDTFGVRPLFQATCDRGVLTFASRAELLHTDDGYDLQYLHDLLAQHPYDHDRTIYPGVRAVDGASVLQVRPDRRDITTFWTAHDVQSRSRAPRSEREQIAEFRTLFADAVRLRLDDGAHTWSHLSGGLDSSSVVSMAQWLAQSRGVEHGLAGTVSFVEPRVGGADEREYSDAVVGAWGVRNETVPHQATWQDILRDPPHLDQPDRPFRTAIRDRKAAHIVREAGGHILFTGMGGDNIALTTMFFFADWVAQGQVARATREMLHRAAIGRVSFWELAFRNAALPLLPRVVRRRLMPRSEGGTPPWVRGGPSGVRRAVSAELAERFYGGRVGHKYADALAASIALVRFTMTDRFADDLVELRHPFLHRPLVELALRLPPELCVRPHQRKWVMREAMRGILPDAVRARVGKGEAQGIYRWSLLHDRPFTDALLREPILADLGCVDAHRLRAVVRSADSEQRVPDWMSSCAYMTLDVELWLQLRDGRWAADHSQPSSGRLAGVQ